MDNQVVSARPLGRALVLMAGLTLCANSAWATRHPHAPMPPAYVEECGGCHLPYAAEFLSAEGWRKLMGHLQDHFKVDAEVDPETAKSILAYLVKHAGHKSSFDPGPAKLKITQTLWFRGTHADASRGHWPKHKTRSNCLACHPKAGEDDFTALSDPDY